MVHLGHPYFLARLLCVQTIEYSVAAKNYKVICVILNTDMVYLRICDYHIWVAIVFFHFGLTISKSTRYGESTRQHSNWTLCNRTAWSCQHDVIILINLSSGFQDPCLFWCLWWFVIIRDWCKLLSLIGRHDCSGVTGVCEPYVIVNYEHDDCTRPRFVSDWNLVLAHERFFSLFEPIEQGLLWILRKLWLICNNVVQVVSQKLCASMSTVTIKDREEWSLLDPRSQWLIWFGSWLLQVKDDWNTVFVIISWCTIMCVGSICQHCSLSFTWNLWRLHFWNDLPKRADAMIAYRRCCDTKSIRSINLSLLYLADEGTLGLDVIHQTRQSLWTGQTLHAWHSIWIIEISHIQSMIINGRYFILLLVSNRVLTWSEPKVLRTLILIILKAIWHHLNGWLIYLWIFNSLINLSGLSWIGLRILMNILNRRRSWGISSGWLWCIVLLICLLICLITAIYCIVAEELASSLTDIRGKSMAIASFDFLEILLFAFRWNLLPNSVVNRRHLRHQRMRSILCIEGLSLLILDELIR